MNDFFVEEKEDTPQIIVNYTDGFLEIRGKSLPEDSIEFFSPFEDAVKEYIVNQKSQTTINLHIEYLNSASQKRLLEIISLFEDLAKDNNRKVIINWYYIEDDEDMLEEGRDFAKMLNLPINIEMLNQ